jgi:ribosomal protein L40E
MSDGTTDQRLGRYEMLWDCAFCGAARLLGATHRYCPECGAPQDQTRRYFPREDEKVAVADDYAGTDRACAHCGYPNGARATFCAKCGAALDEAAAVRRRAAQTVPAGQAFAADDAERAHAELTGAPRPAPAPRRRSRLWIYLLVAALAIGVAIWFFFIRKRDAELEVAEQRWARVVAIEEYRDVEKESWQHQLPATARTISCYDKTYETKKVRDGEDCRTQRVDQGDGTFEERRECTPRYRSEPVQRPWCRYAVREWTEVDQQRAETRDGSEPGWPEVGLGRGEQVLGSRRQGARRERFELDLIEPGGKRHTCAVGQALWTKLPPGTVVRGEARARSGEIVCSTIKPK